MRTTYGQSCYTIVNALSPFRALVASGGEEYKNVNGRQRLVLVLGAGAVVVAVLYPPWIWSTYRGTKFLGHHFLFDNGLGSGSYYTIHFELLVLEVLVLAGLTATAWWVLKDWSPKAPEWLRSWSLRVLEWLRRPRRPREHRTRDEAHETKAAWDWFWRR